MELEFNKRIFTTKEFFKILVKAFGSMKYMRRARKRKLIDEDFIHRIMLAVTEVNGCRVCSYFHTEQALKDGMGEDEITAILRGSLDAVPPKEGKGLFFAQHYADKRGAYSIEAWEGIINEYGQEKARAILSYTRMIMMGNVYGIAYGCLKERFKGKPVKGSRFLHEMGILAGSVILIPAAMIASLFAGDK